MPGNSWSREEDELLLTLSAEGATLEFIGERIGRSYQSCQVRRTRLAKARGKPARVRQQNLWTDEQVQRLVHLREVEKLPFAQIDALLGRKKGCSGPKYVNVKLSAGVRAKPAFRPASVPEYQDITAEFFGDPRPGRSALDARERAST